MGTGYECRVTHLTTSPQPLFVVYDIKLTSAVARVIPNDPRLVCLILYGSSLNEPSTVPILSHLPASAEKGTPSALNPVHVYTSTSHNFVLPHVAEYDPGNAALAHSRSLVFLRKWLEGPIFDLEAIWDEHCYFEFDVRSVAKTMGTMVVSQLALFPHTPPIFTLILLIIISRQNPTLTTFQRHVV